MLKNEALNSNRGKCLRNFGSNRKSASGSYKEYQHTHNRIKIMIDRYIIKK